MRALVTNDDGIGSEGIRQLALTAVGLGLDVVVAAPFQDSSGASASLLAVQDDNRIVVERRRLEGLDGVPAYAVAAAPGYITLLAVREAFGPAPDIVLSGINRGLNVGHAILHSGTVGAALTGSTLGRRGVAVSLESGWPEEPAVLHWETAAHVAAQVIAWVVDPSVLGRGSRSCSTSTRPTWRWGTCGGCAGLGWPRSGRCRPTSRSGARDGCG